MADKKRTFVFGSNELGLHGGGAAFVAKRDFGARYERKGGPGQGFGPQGNSFAIPTCSTTTSSHDHAISFKKLKFYIDCYLLWATITPEEEFDVTQIGCGLAGWKPEEVAPLFVNAPDNCYFDTAWLPWLGEKTASGAERKYWGHVA